ncbi:MAG TPA: hypothetical protein VFU13_08045 [Steroidobacteraceae bacterium]|nr:hypothetical protein [Steroidobacteraceae bacterium]
MNIRKVVAISGLALLSAAPFAAHAGGAGKATDACIQAFVDAYLPKDAAVRVRKPGPAASPLGMYTRHYKIDLSAHVGATGNEPVTARCVANADGEVLALNTKPVSKDGVRPGVAASLK